MRELVLNPTEQMRASRRDPIMPLVTRNLGYAIDGTKIIDAVNIRIEAGGCTAVMGYNGAGKSVLLRLLHGLITPSTGSVTWKVDQNTAASAQSMVFQSPVLLRRTVAANVRYGLVQRRYPRNLIEARLRRVLEETNLFDLRDRAAGVLSGGERQRVALARALAPEPDIVFLDEPTASLDPAATLLIEEILQRAMLAGRKLVFVTQSVAQAGRLADDVIFLHHGRVTEHTPMKEFLAAPQSIEGRAFTEGRLLK